MNGMLSRELVTEQIRSRYEYLKAEFGVETIGLFGSVRTGDQSEQSDIDLMVELSQPIGFRFIELAEYLEQLLGASVNLLTPEGIEGIRNPEISASIKNSIEYV